MQRILAVTAHINIIAAFHIKQVGLMSTAFALQYTCSKTKYHQTCIKRSPLGQRGSVVLQDM